MKKIVSFIIAVVILASCVTVATAAKGGFSDVSSDDYFYNAVLWAVENGITAGTSKTTFSPDDVCTRGQIVTFMYRAK